jgi:hypothetical protein
MDALVGRIADGQRLDLGRQELEEARAPRPARTPAGLIRTLAGVAERVACDPVGGQREVGVVRDDQRRHVAELERDALVSRTTGDLPPERGLPAGVGRL